MKKRSLAVIIVLVLVVLVALAASTVTLAAFNQNKKAIIIVTALMSGGLYDGVTGEPVWDPIPYDLGVYDFMNVEALPAALETIFSDSEKFNKMLEIIGYAMSGEQNADNLIWKLSLDQYGVPNYPDLKVSNDYKGRLYYGALNAYKEQFEDLKARYGREYEVRMFNYDWRIDNRDNSRLLEEFINSNNYSKVIFTSHSMGAQVVSGYLARSAENRDKVLAYCAYAGAFMGAVDALTYLEDINKVLEFVDVGELLNSFGLGAFLPMDMLIDFLNTQMKPMIQNMPGIIGLLPNWEFLNSDQYITDHGITIGGVPIASEDDLYEFYSTREWSYLRNDDGTIMTEADGVTPKLKPFVASLRDFHDSLYVTLDDGSRVQASTLVNTHYFAGQNMTTCIGIDYAADASVSSMTLRRSLYGDAIVPLYSALAGRSIADLGDRYHTFDATFESGDVGNHVNVGCMWRILKDATCAIIDSISG